jgi:hypothetical protein
MSDITLHSLKASRIQALYPLLVPKTGGKVLDFFERKEKNRDYLKSQLVGQ